MAATAHVVLHKEAVTMRHLWLRWNRIDMEGAGIVGKSVHFLAPMMAAISGSISAIAL